jgi:hypothetical protein
VQKRKKQRLRRRGSGSAKPPPPPPTSGEPGTASIRLVACPKKKEATPSPSIQFLQQSTVPKEVRPHEESFEGAIEGANEATHDESNEGVNELESCCYSDFFHMSIALPKLQKIYLMTSFAINFVHHGPKGKELLFQDILVMGILLK